MGQDIFITVGVTPGLVAGTNSYVSTQLKGWTFALEQRQFGTLDAGVDYSLLNNPNASEWGFELTGDAVFIANTVYVVHAQQNSNVVVANSSSVSNGFNLTRVYGAFCGRVGWLQPTKANSPVLSGSVTASSSGRYYNDDSAHALCSIDNLYQAQEDENITPDNFNALLGTLDQTVILRCLGSIFNRPQKIDSGLVYERSSNVRTVPIPNQGNFCGYRIKVTAGDYSVFINTMSLYFNGVATFNIYLFNDLRLAPIATQSVTTVANDQTVVQLTWQLDYIDASHKGGLFYIGYFQNDLPSGVLAIDEQLNLWDNPKIFGAYPFQAPQIGSLDFNRINPSVVFRTYGLNMEMASYRDWTQTIVQNANMFDEVRCLAMAVVVINKIRNSTRTNSVNRMTAEDAKQIQFDVDLAFPTKDLPLMAGLRQQITRELKRINDNFFPKPEAMSVPISLDEKRLGGDTILLTLKTYRPVSLHIKTTTVGIDKPVQKLQSFLYLTLKRRFGITNETDYRCFGRAYKNKTDDGYTPEAFDGGIDYKELYLDDNVKLLSFFGIGEEQKTSNGSTIASVYLIFSGNASTLMPSTTRTDEEIFMQIRNALAVPRFGFTVKGFSTGIDAVYKEYSGVRKREGLKYRDMQPYFNFRVNFDLLYDAMNNINC